MIRAHGVGKTYSDHTVALAGVNLGIEPGELVFVTGDSGAGKTTLLKLLIGWERPTAGQLSVNGVDMTACSERELRRLRRTIGPVFQDFRLLKGYSALANVAVGLRMLHTGARQIRSQSLAVLEQVGLGERCLTDVDKLSWGEQQRVAIARALVRKPALVLADEPTGNLDHDRASQVIDLLAGARAWGAIVVVATHALDQVERAGARSIHLQRGMEVAGRW